MSLLILSPLYNYSRGIVPTAPGTTFVANYPAANATDDSSATVAKITALSGTLTIDLGTSRMPTVVGVINHTYDDGNLVLEGSMASDFGALTSTITKAVTKPNMYFDLRAYAAVGQRYFRVYHAAFTNSVTVAVGEFVIGLADEYGGVIEPGYDRLARGFAARDITEYGVLVKVTSGCEHRALRLQTRLPLAERALMADTFYRAGTTGYRVLVVPDTAQEDVFWIDWPSLLSERVPHHLERGIPLDLPEEMAGIV